MGAGVSLSAVAAFDALERNVNALSQDYGKADPFPHIVFDDFLDPEVFAKAVAEFQELDSGEWINWVHANERKFGNKNPEEWGPNLREILAQLNSPEFVAFLSRLIGVDGLFADDTLEGGGLHRSITGGFLNIHADFTVHPHHRNWQRRANILVYLTEDWEPEYGGALEFWDQEMKECRVKLPPISNRAVIFTTSEDSFHGHPIPMTCPEGVARRSLALYYFTEEEDPLVRSTEYRARPGDGLRSVTIFTDKYLLRAYDGIKRWLGFDDDFASRVLGFWNRGSKRGKGR